MPLSFAMERTFSMVSLLSSAISASTCASMGRLRRMYLFRVLMADSKRPFAMPCSLPLFTIVLASYSIILPPMMGSTPLRTFSYFCSMRAMTWLIMEQMAFFTKSSIAPARCKSSSLERSQIVRDWFRQMKGFLLRMCMALFIIFAITSAPQRA